MLLRNAILTLMIGPNIPVPAPVPVIEALQSVQVTSSRDRSGFQLTFTVGKRSALQLALLPSGYFDPVVTRVVITITLNGMPTVIMDGFITRQELQPSNEPGKSTLTITGDDLTVSMDIIEKAIPYPAAPDAAKVTAIIGQYAYLGMVPSVVPPVVPVTQSPTGRTESQAGMTDLQYLNKLAKRNGYVFYIDPGPIPSQSIAYFGPEINVSVPQRALSVNMDAHTNVDSLNFSLDGMQKEQMMMTIFDPITGKIPIPVPVPNINASKPPLGLRSTPPAKIKMHTGASRLKADEAARDILSSMMNSSSDIKGNGSLDVMRYGQILQARKLVGVRGAGLSYDGLYFVDSVTHDIKQGAYTQNFTLSRDGLISNTPVVIP